MNLSGEQPQGGGIELGENKSSRREVLDPDNPTPEMMYHCKTYYRRVLNPIVDWTTDEVWEFIREYNVRYCELYDQGYTRLGCIGCPMGSARQRLAEFARYPKYRANYVRAFDKMLGCRHDKGLDIKEGAQDWQTGEDVMEWWLELEGTKQCKGQVNVDEK